MIIELNIFKITNKLDTHPCILTCENMGFLRHLIKTSYLQREKINDFYNVVNLGLEINPRNGLIKTLYSLHKNDPELAKLIAEQVHIKLYLIVSILFYIELIFLLLTAFR